jgi:hypothetical protein
MYKAKQNPQSVLKPQDLVVLLRLSLVTGAVPTYAALAAELGLTASEIHAGLERASIAQLARKDMAGKPSAVREALKLFVIHGARYAFPVVRGEATRGTPTGYAAPPLKEKSCSRMRRRPSGRTKMGRCAEWCFVRCILPCLLRPGEIRRCTSCWRCSMPSGGAVRASGRWPLSC